MAMRLRQALVVALAALPSAGLGIAPAHAAPGVVSYVGNGTYSPGLQPTGPAMPQNVTGNFTFVGDTFGPCAVHLAGTATGTLASESGSGVLSGCVTGAISWSRSGPVHTVSGRNCVNSFCFCYTASAGAWAAADTSPSVSYWLMGSALVTVPC